MRRSSVVVVAVWLFACADSDLFGREGEPRVDNDVGGMAGSPGSSSDDVEGHGHDQESKDKNEGGTGGAPGAVSSASSTTTGGGGEPREPDDDD